MATKNDEERTERRLGIAVAVSLVLNIAALWGLAQTSANRGVPASQPLAPLTPISLEAPLPRLRGLLPEPKASPTPPPSAEQTEAAIAAGKLPTPVLPPADYPGVQPFPAGVATATIPILPTPLPIPTPNPNAPKPVQVTLRARPGTVSAESSPGGFKPITLPPPGSEVPLAGEKTGFKDTPTPKPAPTPVPTPTPAPSPKPDASPSPTPTPKGDTRDAEPLEKFPPEIPPGLKFKPQVKLSIDVDIDGSAEYAIRTSSGNAEVDQYVLDALHKWKWTSALRNGKPLATSFEYIWNF